MAANIARAGFPMTVSNRTPRRAALPVTALASPTEAGLVAQGLGDDDDSALARAIRDWAGL